MGTRTFTVTQWTPVAVADNAVFTDGGHVSIQGGSSTQLNYILEIHCSGLAASGSPTILQLARHSTVGASLTALAAPNSDVADHPSFSPLASVVLPFIASTTKPKADQVNKLYPFAFDAWGGIVRKKWQRGEKCMLGNTASNGELGLNAYDGTGDTPGSMSTAIQYETE